MSGGPDLPGGEFSLEKPCGFWLHLDPLPSAGQKWRGTCHPACPMLSSPWVISWVTAPVWIYFLILKWTHFLLPFYQDNKCSRWFGAIFWITFRKLFLLLKQGRNDELFPQTPGYPVQSLSVCGRNCCYSWLSSSSAMTKVVCEHCQTILPVLSGTFRLFPGER